MKRIITVVFATMLFFNLNAQKKANGKMFIEHPAINLAENVMQKFINGDEDLADLLDDNFRAISGVRTDKSNEGSTKEEFLNQSRWWSNNFDNLSITRDTPAYPDAIEYKDSGTWVQTWERLYGVNKTTGFIIDMPIHRLFWLNEDETKVRGMFIYANTSVFSDMWESYNPRTNGTIYKSHENINKVRKLVAAFLDGDLEKAHSFYSPNATFYDINMPKGESMNLDQAKELNKSLFENFEILSIDEYGYPDFLDYEHSASKVVLAWWDVRVKRKSDGKTINFINHETYTFNGEGKIIRQTSYYNGAALNN